MARSGVSRGAADADFADGGEGGGGGEGEFDIALEAGTEGLAGEVEGAGTVGEQGGDAVLDAAEADVAAEVGGEGLGEEPVEDRIGLRGGGVLERGNHGESFRAGWGVLG